MTRIRRRTLTSLINDGANSKHGLLPADYKQLLQSLSLEYPKFEKILLNSKNQNVFNKDGSVNTRKPILVKDMSEAEMLIVTRGLQDLQTSRGWIKYVQDNFNSELRYVNPNSNQNEILNVMSSIFSEAGSIITSPPGRTLLGMISKTDAIIRQRSTEDMIIRFEW